MATIIDQSTVHNDNFYFGVGGIERIFQSFTGSGLILHSATFTLGGYSTKTGTITCKIYAHSGTFGTSSLPTGSPLAVSDETYDISTFSDSISERTFNFSGANKILLTNGTKYVVVFEGAGADGCTFYTNNGTSVHAGNGGYYISGAWTVASSWDVTFKVYGDSPTTSERSARIRGKSTSNSERSAKTTGKLTSNSDRPAKTTGIAGDLFSRETKAALPSTVANLEPIYNATDVTNVATDNDVFVDLDVTITGYAIHQYKKLNSNNTDKIDITWKGKSSVATSSQAVRLQIYNNTSGLWETLDTESSAGVGVEFTLIGSVTTSLSSYYDANNIVIMRVYQQFT